MEAEGEICNRYEYDAWGNLTTCEEQIENHFRFAGQQLDPSGNFCDNAADRICNLIDERRIRGNNRSSLENYLKEKAGNLTDAERRVAKKLGLEVETGGKSGGNSESGIISNLDDGLNFSNRALEHMGESGRQVPIQTLQDAIRYGDAMPDPRGSNATMYYTTMYKNGKMYNLEVLYDEISNTVYHFEYARKAMGNLPAIPK